jgi:hypothetical protein
VTAFLDDDELVSVYSPRYQRDNPFLSLAQVRALSDDDLLERWEDLYERLVNEPDSNGRLRQQLDTLTREAQSAKRKLINWTL